jgi:hypothetical protein
MAAEPSAPAAEKPSLETLVSSFRVQARGCANAGSPIYAELLDRAAADLESGGIFAELVAEYRGQPILDALHLRILGRVHALVLSGEAPGLARFYPSAGGRFEAEPAWRALLDLAHERRDLLRDAALHWNVQTNEVRRSAALLPGFLRVAAHTKLPLRLREIGASGGLNQIFDRHHYQLGPHRWGDPGRPLAIQTDWEGPAPDLDAPLRIADRCGCDVAPIDLRDPAAQLKMESFFWPEQLDRLERLRAAIRLVAADPPAIERAPAGDWVERELAPQPGIATVLFHSVVWWYIPEAERKRIARAMDAHAARATADAPLAWLRMEGARVEEAELRLRLWPGGEDTLLGAVQWHGAWVRWVG